MTIDFEDESGDKLDIDLYEIAQRVIDGAIDYMECPYEVYVGLTVTDNEEIHRLNREHRQIDRPTDVLSFPMIDFETPGEFEWLEEEDDCFDPESGELVLGDIVISADKVLEQAEAYGHSVTREYAFLITHSILHLLGYDHMTKSDAARMEQIQKDILETLHIAR
ncbi:MAG: rRNA maturation RNase YbeY [Clostridiales bacterium]|nr:rRNA maturation RNase YbeY [Clostridiales bacterium]MCC8105369.1 rRNA maturation RNase YbeY [Clostridiales bacterium]